MHQFHKVKGTYNHQKDDCFLSYERDLIDVFQKKLFTTPTYHDYDHNLTLPRRKKLFLYLNVLQLIDFFGL